MLTPCPDCGAEPADVVVHAESCPLVRGISAQAAVDAVWFQQHPGQDRLLRVATVAERVVLGAGGLIEVARPVSGGDGG